MQCFAVASRLLSVCMVVIAVGIASSAHATGPLLLRDPSLSATQIAFAFGGDIWVASRDGSGAHRVTNGGAEAKPVFSPDGSQIAFIGEFGPERAVYVVGSAGGTPRRLTYHSADLGLGSMPDVLGWTPDGQKIFFNSRRAAFFGYPGAPYLSQLYEVPVSGGFAKSLPLERAVQASYSPDATRLAYVPNVQRQLDWRRYRGGETTSIWIVNLADSSIQDVVPRENSNDSNPIWVGSILYFLSDRSGPTTLFAYDVEAHKVSQIIKNSGHDIKSASILGQTVIYEKLGELHLYDLKTSLDSRLSVDIQAAQPTQRQRLQIDPAQIRFADLSPNGSEFVIGIHGELLTGAANRSSMRNFTSTSDISERDPAWSPDGRLIAYFSDRSGEYALAIKAVAGTSQEIQIPLGPKPTFYYSPAWSTDSEKIAYVDKQLQYWYLDVRKKEQPSRFDTAVSTDPTHTPDMAWSVDSRWIAYSKIVGNYLHAVFLYDTEDKKSYQITDGTSDALHVAFDKDGQYLYFSASVDVGPSAGWFDMGSFQQPVTRSVYAVRLTDPAQKGMQVDGHQGCASQGSSENINPIRVCRLESTRVEILGIEHRIERVSTTQRNIYAIKAGRAGSLYILYGDSVEPPQSTLPGASIGMTTSVAIYERQSKQFTPLLTGVVAFNDFLNYRTSLHVSADGKHLLFFKDGDWRECRVEAAHQCVSMGAGLIIEHPSIVVDQQAEWRHMFEQVWRDERDFFYNAELSDIDLRAVKAEYSPFLEGIRNRNDLNYLFNDMLGVLGVSHLLAAGGTGVRSDRPTTGLLGADFSVEHARYKFARLYQGDVWDPAIRAPLLDLCEPVRPGEFLLAVNGQPVSADRDIYSYFEDLADRPTVIRIGPRADGVGARSVTVVPLSDEAPLRLSDWVLQNRRKVDELSGGRVAYIYMSDTDARGLRQFNQQYYSQVGKDALVLDERYNRGGLSADFIVDRLARVKTGNWYMREGKDLVTPQETIFGPKVMIVNEMTGSGGDFFAWLFHRAGLGPLVGKRTWGGLIGSYTMAGDLLDGGSLTTPNLAFFSPEGGAWEIENRGVPPDIEVEDDPRSARDGHDLQLERAVSAALDALAKNPPASPVHPPFLNSLTGQAH